MGKAVAKQQNLRSKASLNSVTKLENRIISNSLAPSCVEHQFSYDNHDFTGSSHKDLVGVVDDRHRHLQTCGGVLLAAAHLDQSDEVQVIKAMAGAFTT